MFNRHHMKCLHLRLGLFTPLYCSMLFGHLFHSAPVKDVDHNCQ